MSRTGVAARIVPFVMAGVICTALVAIAGGPPNDAKYIGSDKCKICHLKEYKTWSKTKHAKNFDALQGDEQKNPDCLKCHTTGYGEPGGFVSVDETPKLKNTGCEECHGPGSAHADVAQNAPDSGEWDKKINKAPQNTCAKCHNPHINQKERVEKLRAGG